MDLDLLDADEDEDGPLFDAIWARQPLDAIRAIVEARPELVRRRSANELILDMTALHVAATQDLPVESVRFLYFAWPQALREGDWKPLHCLVNSHNVFPETENDGGLSCVETAQFLIEQRPDALQDRTLYGLLPLHVAAGNPAVPPELLRLLIERGGTALLRDPGGEAGRLPIHDAVMWGCDESVRVLLEADPESIREKDQDGKTPLHHAASGENLPRGILLMERWPQALREPDNRGFLPLHAAAGARDATAAGFALSLLDGWPGAVRVRTKEGFLPLALAAMRRSAGLLRRLVREWPESVRERDGNGRLALHHVVAFADDDALAPPAEIVESAQFLIEQWPESIHERDKMGRTLLHMAVNSSWFWLTDNNDNDVLNFLIERIPACLQVQDQQGQIPLHLADVPNVAGRLLEAWPAAVRVQDRLGRLPVHVMMMNSGLSSFLADHQYEDVIYDYESRDESRLTTARLVAEASPDSLLVPDQQARLPLHILLERDEEARDDILLERDDEARDTVRFLVNARPRALQARDRQGRLPMHVWAAQREASVEVANALVEPWPESLLVADDQGRLSLHVLLEREDASLDAVRLLVETRLESLLIKDHQGRLPLHVWVSHSNSSLDVARLLVEASPRALHLKVGIPCLWRSRKKIRLSKWSGSSSRRAPRRSSRSTPKAWCRCKPRRRAMRRWTSCTSSPGSGPTSSALAGPRAVSAARRLGERGSCDPRGQPPEG